MKVLIFQWHSSANLSKIGLEHNRVTNRDLYDLIDWVLFNDLNVMVQKAKSEVHSYDYILYIDTKSFNQR